MDNLNRKANWNESSVSLLVDLVTDPERWAVIRGKFSPSLTIQKKQRVWEEIAERINASSTCMRNLKDVKKKWQDLQSHTKKKEASRKLDLKKTGGGPPPPELKCWEQKIISVLSNDVISGVEGGFDSLDTASLSTDTGTLCGKESSKRRYGELDNEPEVGMEAPSSFSFYQTQKTSTCTSNSRSSCSNEEDSQPAVLVSPTTAFTSKHYTEGSVTCNNRKKVNRVPPESSMNQQRYIEIEEEKLAIMRENLEIEKRKLELLEQYVQWRVETPADHFVTPSVSPIIRGLIASNKHLTD